MYLTKEEEKIINGEYGEALALALKVIVKVGEHLGAEKLVKVRHVHISGVSYSNIGDPGLRFLSRMVKRLSSNTSIVKNIYVTSNPTCIDLSQETRIFDRKLVEGQLLINSVLERMGVKPTYTCIPYVIRRPNIHEHLCWGESNAVIMANSYYGAYTNREGGPLTVMAALTGRTYYAGLHLIENRIARTLVSVNLPKVDDEYASLIGLYIGYNVNNIPLIKRSFTMSFENIKLMLASSAASGNHGLIVLESITPRNTYIVDIKDKISIDKESLEYFREKISSETEIRESTLAYIGCPHLSLTELIKLAKLVKKYRKVRKNVVFLITVPGLYMSLFNDIIELLKSKGITIAYGTCPVVSKLTFKPDIVLTNSGKACFYLNKIFNVDVSLTSIDDIVKVVMEK